MARRRRRLVSDPREIAALVLDTPGMAEKLAEACAGIVHESERELVRATVKRTLVEMADGWAIDNFGQAYKWRGNT